MRASSRIAGAFALAATAICAVAAPAGCFFPNYTFDKNTGGAGGGTGPSMTSNGGAHNVGGSTNTNGNGGSTGGNGPGTCTCADAPPTGFTGFFALYDGDPSGDPGCPAEYPNTSGMPYSGGRDLDVPDADCSSYTCSPPSGGTCGALPTTLHVSDAKCNGTEHCYADLDLGGSGQCFDDGALAGGVTTCGPQVGNPMSCTTGSNACNVSLSAAVVAGTGGTCASCGGTAVLPSATYKKLGHGCGDPTPVTPNDCNPGQTCLPNPSSIYSGVCIMQTGDVDCPLGKFGNKHVFYTGKPTEGRSCSDCQCEAATGQTCKTTITVYAGNTVTCSGTVVATVTAGQCDDDASIANQQIGDRRLTQVDTVPSGGNCPHTGGDPMGTATPANPTTFCCTE